MKVLIISILTLIPLAIISQGNANMFATKNALKISIFEFAKEEFQISYERYFNDRKSSITIMPSVILKDDMESQKEGWSVMSQYRFYLTHYNKGKNNNFLGFENYGLYTGVYASYLDFTEDYTAYYWDEVNRMSYTKKQTKDISAVEGGVIVGMQIDFSTRIIMDIYLGGGIKRTDLIDSINEEPNDDNNNNYYSYGVFDREYEGVKPRLGCQLGFTF